VPIIIIKDYHMGHDDAGHFAAKHSEKDKPAQTLLDAVNEMSIDGSISCYTAFKLASNLKEKPENLGIAIDFLEIKISKCQLGLFGYQPDKKIARIVDSVLPELQEKIQKRLMGNKLTCNDAWEIAQGAGIKKMDVADACETLKIKISRCQLGAF
jgi:hypothetical protein